MDFFPLFAKLTDQPCLVIGGGVVAHRKVLQLLKAGARVTVNAPELGAELAQLARTERIEVVHGKFNSALPGDYVLIIAATSDAAVNARVADACQAQRRLCNVVDDGTASGFIMPSVIDRSPLMIALSTGGESPVLARMIRQQIEAWLPSRLPELVRWAGRWRDAVKQRIQSHEERLRFWQTLLEGPAAEQVLTGRISTADRQIQARLTDPGETDTTGEAWIVGAGPGDPDLITRRGLQLLQKADAVLHDRLVAPELLDAARRDAEIVSVGKSPGGPSVPQEEINAQLVQRVRAGQRVCRLKGGDPFIFGRGGEEIAALAAAGLPYQVIPGISAANGCAAYAGIPLTQRHLASAVTLVTASLADEDDPVDWPGLARGKQTLVFYMGVRQLEKVVEELTLNGMNTNTPAAVIEQGTRPEQRIVGGTLGNIAVLGAAARIGAPAILIVGAVAQLAQELNGFGPEVPADRRPEHSEEVVLKSNNYEV
jgi:uroporphyrin-III C-methyltransferase/precorrin-2 dehydrogenase/sirohydrochlorin ferrochelatase